ncbi:MAG: carboxypeptidase-like regulatory domain-containing protein [Opitutaceae bacterium]
MRMLPVLLSSFLVVLPLVRPGLGGAESAGRVAAAGTVAGRIQNVATGQYLNNARVAVQGTDRVAFSDPTGTYRLSGLPAGPVVLEVFFTGMDPQQVSVTVRGGETLTQDVNLTNVARYGADASGTVKLDSFIVSTARETDGAAIAINEQRFAPNLKNVIAADALGDVMDGKPLPDPIPLKIQSPISP